MKRTLVAGACAVAPLALVFPWCVAPSKLGIGLGGPGFFFHLATKHPNLGPIHWQVVGGIACLIACAVAPPLFLFLRDNKQRTVVLTAHLCAFLAVAVYLDSGLWTVGFYGVWTRAGDAALALGGPTIRLLSTLALLALARARASSGIRPRAAGARATRCGP